MIIEIQQATKAMLAALRERVASENFCNDQPFSLKGELYYVNRVELSRKTRLEIGATATGRPLSLVQPCTLVLVRFKALRDAPKHGTEQTKETRAEIELSFALGVVPTDGGAALTATYTGTTTPELLEGDSEAQFVFRFVLLATLMEAGVQTNSIPISLRPFSRILSTVTPSRVGLSASPDGKRVAIRMTLGEPTPWDGDTFWTAFESGKFVVDSNKDWSFLIDGASVAETFVASLREDLKGDTHPFTLERGPRGSWQLDHAVAGFHGVIRHACAILFFPIDVGMDVTCGLAFSSGGTNRIRVHFTMDDDTDDAGVVGCAIGNVFQFWINAMRFLQSGDMKDWQYALGLLGNVFVPMANFGVTAHFLHHPHELRDPTPAEVQGTVLHDVEHSSHDIEKVGTLELTPPAGMRLDSVKNSVIGPIFEGSFDDAAPPRQIPEPNIEVRSWAWQLRDSCDGNSGFELRAEVLHSSDVELCGKVRVLRGVPGTDLDPAGQFGKVRVIRHADSHHELVLSEQAVTKAYRATPYPCYVWLDFVGHKRIVNLGVLPELTKEIRDGLFLNTLRPACTGLATDAVWGGHWDPDWLLGDPDPGPAGAENTLQLWSLRVHGLGEEDVLELEVRVDEGQARSAQTATLVKSHPASGLAHLTALVSPADGKRLRVLRTGPQSPRKAGTRAMALQQMLLRRRGVLPMASDSVAVTTMRLDRQSFLAIARPGKVELLAVTGSIVREMPPLSGRGIAGAQFVGTSLFVFGAEGVTEWQLSGGEWLQRSKSHDLEQVRGLAPFGDHLAIIAGEKVLLCDRSWKSRRLATPTPLAVCGTPGMLAVGTAEGVDFFDDPSRTKPTHHHALKDLRRLSPPFGDGRQGVVLVEQANGDRRLLAALPSSTVQVLEHHTPSALYPKAHRLGRLLLLPDEPHQLTVWQIAQRRSVQL